MNLVKSLLKMTAGPGLALAVSFVAAVGGTALAPEGRSITALAAEKPQYLKSVTYFGDEWPINYWGSEDKDMDSNFAQIAADGFNSIILVIPWREFQPETLPMKYNQAAFDKLDQVMDCAERHGLWVTLRIGYTWDYYGSSELPKRFQNVMIKDGGDHLGWLDYCRTIYKTASAHDNFHSGFITWEDFWDVTYTLSRDMTMSSRIRLANQIGYQDYLAENYSLEEVNKIYRKDFKKYSEVYVPFREQPSAHLFYEFYDHYLVEFLNESQQVFPGLSMEVRCDGDLVYDQEGNASYYSHSVTYPCEGADHTALMYSVSLGQKNEHDRISADAALASMARSLNNIYQKSGKPLYVEQLLYMDSTAQFSYNTQVIEEQVGDFVSRMGPVLTGPTSGYGLWVYRNYVNNCVYNGQFGFGTLGWTFAGGNAVTEHNGTAMALVSGKGGISQKLAGRLAENGAIHVQLYADPADSSAVLKVALGDTEKEVRVNHSGIYEFSIPWQYGYDLQIKSDKPVYVDDVKVYSYEQYGRIYYVDGSEGDLIGAFRSLNSYLP